MDLERALETQRVKLLRLLTGWFAVVGLLSVGPVAIPFPRWFRSFLDDMLTSAEFAAQCLVQASACLRAEDKGIFVGGLRTSLPLQEGRPVDGSPSVAALIRRMKALRRVLRNLPRYGQRMLRRFLRRDRVVRDDLGFDLWHHRGAIPALQQWIAPEEERPPDKLRFCLLNRFQTPPALQAGGVGVWNLTRQTRATGLALSD